jgi:hypothetical protein
MATDWRVEVLNEDGGYVIYDSDGEVRGAFATDEVGRAMHVMLAEAYGKIRRERDILRSELRHYAY